MKNIFSNFFSFQRHKNFFLKNFAENFFVKFLLSIFTSSKRKTRILLNHQN